MCINHDQSKRNVLGVLINAVDYNETVERIINAAETQKPLSASALAVHGVMTGVMDQHHRHRLNHIDLVVPDGQPVRWALNWLYNTNLHDRVYGPSLMLKICERASQERLPIYLYGSQSSVIDKLSKNLANKFPNLIIAGSQPSRFRQISYAERDEVCKKINNSNATLVFVGLGCPRQEVWVYEYRNFLSMPLIAIGAAFDFHAGTLLQAPSVLQRLGLEWFFRLIHEPKRLWKRYMLFNPIYLIMLLLQKSGLVKYDPLRAMPPEEELLYG